MKIGILTTFSAIVPHYSLSRVVLDQAEMIRHAGHHPVLITLSDFVWKECPEWLEIRRGIPVYTKVDYQTREDLSEEHYRIAEYAGRWLIEQRDLPVIFTHDIIFTGWNLPVGVSVRHATPLMDTYWLHWVHSVPGGKGKDFWLLPLNGKIVYPNHTDRVRCADHFKLQDHHIEVIPHSLDPRNFLMKTELAKMIATDYDLMSADFIQTYPVPTDRMEHKGIGQVIEVFSRLKAAGKSVRVVFCNSWCTTPELHSKVRVALMLAEKRGLTDREVIFTSRIAESLGAGIENEVVRDLMLISNLFVCPTKSETFGMVIAEAALSGQLLVLNSSLPAMAEIAGAGNALYFNFGSLQVRVERLDWSQYYTDIARIILHRFDNDDALKAKTHYRKTYNMDAVWIRIGAAVQHAIGARVTVG